MGTPKSSISSNVPSRFLLQPHLKLATFVNAVVFYHILQKNSKKVFAAAVIAAVEKDINKRRFFSNAFYTHLKIKMNIFKVYFSF